MAAGAAVGAAVGVALCVLQLAVLPRSAVLGVVAVVACHLQQAR